jgi:hypothetical protein
MAEKKPAEKNKGGFIVSQEDAAKIIRAAANICSPIREQAKDFSWGDKPIGAEEPLRSKYRDDIKKQGRQTVEV